MYKTIFFVLLTMSFGVTIVFSGENDHLSESRKIVKQFAGKLKGELISSLEQNGPINTLSVCSQKAPAIAKNISQGKPWAIARTSLKSRNKDHAPDTWEQKTLDLFEKRRSEGKDVQTMEHYEYLTTGEKKVFRYMKAIPVGQPCLTCHGKQIPHDLKSKLLELYPEDQSTGFSLGEIIGAFSVSMPM